MSSMKYKDEEIQVRGARREDMVTVAEMIQELADFEKMSNGPQLSVNELERDGFEAQPPAFRCKVDELTKVATDPIVGYVIYFPTYSTWEGRAIMLEDLYVRPSQRRRGVGERLFNAVTEEASSTGCSRLDFHVLEWNEARAFYEGKGAINLSNKEQWCLYRLAGEALKKGRKMSQDG